MWRCRKDRRFAGPRDRSSASKATKGHQSGWIVITAGWGLGVAVAVYCVGRISGAHINPAVTVGLASIGQFPWSDVASYVAAQMTGAFLGAVIGLVLSIGLSRLLATMLFGVQPLDPLTFASVTVLLAVTAAASTAGPAWRATRIDPVVTLQND